MRFIIGLIAVWGALGCSPDQDKEQTTGLPEAQTEATTTVAAEPKRAPLTADSSQSARPEKSDQDISLGHAHQAANDYLKTENVSDWIDMGSKRLNGVITVTYTSKLFPDLSSSVQKATIGDTLDRILKVVQNEKLEVVLHNGRRKIAAGIYDPLNQETTYKFF